MTKTNWETVKVTNDESFEAYVVRPANENGQAIVLLQEVFGVNACIRDMSRWMSDQGYLVAAPDLYWRIQPHVDLGPSEPPYHYDREATTAAFSYLERFDEHSAVADIAATARHIRETSPQIQAVHLLGVCLGGKMAVLGAQDENIASAISFYGVGIENAIDVLTSARCPIQLHFGGQDKFIPASAVDVIAQASAGRDIEVCVYPGANHGFFSSGRKAYDPAIAATAWTSAIALMKSAASSRSK